MCFIAGKGGGGGGGGDRPKKENNAKHDDPHSFRICPRTQVNRKHLRARFVKDAYVASADIYFFAAFPALSPQSKTPFPFPPNPYLVSHHVPDPVARHDKELVGGERPPNAACIRYRRYFAPLGRKIFVLVLKVPQGPRLVDVVSKHMEKRVYVYTRAFQRWGKECGGGGAYCSGTCSIAKESVCYVLEYFQHAHSIPIVGVGKRGAY